jgi:hypothetical protein
MGTLPEAAKKYSGDHVRFTLLAENRAVTPLAEAFLPLGQAALHDPRFGASMD